MQPGSTQEDLSKQSCLPWREVVLSSDETLQCTAFSPGSGKDSDQLEEEMGLWDSVKEGGRLTGVV